MKTLVMAVTTLAFFARLACERRDERLARSAPRESERWWVRDDGDDGEPSRREPFARTYREISAARA